MKMPRLITALLALIPFVACSVDDGSSASGRYGAPEEAQSFYLQVSLENRLMPDSVNVTFLDKQFRVIRTAVAKPQSSLVTGVVLDGHYMTEPVSVQADYVKMDVAIPGGNLGNGNTMHFSRYAKADDYEPLLNIFTAMSSRLVERLMMESSLPYDTVMARAYDNIEDFFGFGYVDYENSRYNNSGPGVTPYLYCRYFTSDSIFYHDFRELEAAIDEGAWGDTLFRVRAADELLRYFGMENWTRKRGLDLNDPANLVPDFWEVAYGMERCTDSRIGDTLANANRRSDFYDSIFVCDRVHDSTANVNAHWRLVTAAERDFGYCLYGSDKVVERDSAFYHCARTGWQKTDDMDVVIRNTFERCDTYRIGDIYEFRGTPYICHSYTYRDTVGLWPGFGYASTYAIGYAWTDDAAVIDSVYPGGIPDTSSVEEEKPWEKD